MAGIVATMPKKGKDLESMLARLRHRGPQTTWIHQSANSALGCCVLYSESISPGRAYAEKNGQAVVVDGHVYNQDRQGLSEAEFVLHLYEKFGSGFAERMGGDFACAIATDNELILARDSIALKPLYYGNGQGGLFFASEAKALLDMATEIAEFPPSHIYTSRKGFQPYPSFKEVTPDFDTPEQGAHILAELLRQAVHMCMDDNVPSGVLLSGGHYSGIIALLAKEFKPDIETFAAGLVDSQQLQWAREMSRYLGTTHHELVYERREIAEVLPQAIYYLESFDEDSVHEAVEQLLVARLAARYVACVLCSEGADEFICGYQPLKETDTVAKFTPSRKHLIRNIERMMGACSLEFRTPFLDPRVISFCSKIPADRRIYDVEELRKWILHKAFFDRIPNTVLEWEKGPFAQGASSARATKSIAERVISRREYLNNQETDLGLALKSRAELYYYRIFKEKLPHPALVRMVALEALEQSFTLRDRSEVIKFLENNPSLFSVLQEAHKQIRKYFRRSPQIVLEVVSDPEIAEEQELAIFIRTNLPPSEASKKLGQLDEKWWLDISLDARKKICIDVEFE